MSYIKNTLKGIGWVGLLLAICAAAIFAVGCLIMAPIHYFAANNQWGIINEQFGVWVMAPIGAVLDVFLILLGFHEIGSHNSKEAKDKRNKEAVERYNKRFGTAHIRESE